MRTLRELAGWGLLFLVQLTPLIVLGLLVYFFEEDDSGWALLSALLLTLLWPRMLLSARRLREPSEDEVAEADGRRPVVLLHRFTRVAAPLVSRALFVQPGLWRDWRDARRERAIERAMACVGPIVSLERPAPPPSFGPLRLDDDSAWRLELDRHLRRAGLAVIVLDGSEANALEIERAAALLGLSRTILVIPPELSASGYASLHARLPLLPELDGRARAIRFGAEDRPFYMSSLLVAPGEAVPQPKPPLGTWLLAVLAVFAGLYSAISTPLLLDGRVHANSEAYAWGGFVAVALGVVLAGLSRRAVRLVPANEAVMVVVAAFPWLVTETIGFLVAQDGAASYTVRSTLEKSAIGAAYSAPLLAAAAIILAASSLVRRAPGRRRSFATFGAAALLPFWPLAMSLDAIGVDVTEIVFGLFAGALGLGLAAWGASGEPAREHAPLPIGAAVAGALSVAAFAAITSHDQWAGLLTDDGYAARAAEALDRVPALSTFSSAWPWFALAGPAVIVLVALQFSRRTSRPAVASMAAFVPFVILCTLASASEGRARARVDGSHDVLAPAEGVALAPGFELAQLTTYAPPIAASADLVVDRSGLIAGGERLATLEELALGGSYGAPPALARTFYGIAAERGTGEAPRLAVRRDMDVSHLLRVVRAARRAGFAEVQLLGSSPAGDTLGVRLATAAMPAGAEEPRLYVLVQPYAIVLCDSTGMRREIPHAGGAIDDHALREAVRERRQLFPNERDVNLVIQTYPGADEAAHVGALLGEQLGRVALVEHAPF